MPFEAVLGAGEPFARERTGWLSRSFHLRAVATRASIQRRRGREGDFASAIGSLLV
jgi:hypothetical protein